jgi:hypothetical protein
MQHYHALTQTCGGRLSDGQADWRGGPQEKIIKHMNLLELENVIVKNEKICVGV